MVSVKDITLCVEMYLAPYLQYKRRAWRGNTYQHIRQSLGIHNIA